MRKLALLLAGALLAVSAAVALAPARADEGTATKRITVVLKNRDYKVIDLPPGGTSHGDVRVGNADLYDRRETRRIGTFHLFCALTDPADEPGETAELTECLYTYRLPGGEVTTQGVNRRPSLGDVATADVDGVTGGTGRFRTARGDVHLLPSQGDKRTIVLRLVL